ncbi:MAG: cell division protein FtsQ/DivIB [Alphaproteobacteria bacterium]
MSPIARLSGAGPRLGGVRRPAVRRRIARLSWLRSRRVAIVAGCLAAIAIAAAGIGTLHRMGVHEAAVDGVRGLGQAALRASAQAGLGVREIVVVGRRFSPAQDIVAATGLREGAPLLAFDPAAARAALERMPWIRSAAVERRFPGTVRIEVVERRPVALWQEQGRFAVLDEEGGEIRGADPGAFPQLVVVIGPDAPRHANELLRLLTLEPELAGRVGSASRVAGRRWDLVIADSGPRILLPEADPGAALARLAELQRRERLLERSIAQVDLRLADRIALRPLATAAAEAQQAAPQGGRPRGAIRGN